MKQTIKSFKDLNAWNESHQLVLMIYKISKKFPLDERFGLTNQIRRAVISTTSNIAEGFGRNSAKDKAHFYAIAKGSVLEVQSQLIATKDLDYVTLEEFQNIDKHITIVVKLISGLIRSVMDR